MNHRTIVAAAFLLAATAAVAGESKASLQAQAKISEAAARATALQRVPDGRIASAELENEHGKLIWSFDVTRPASRDVTEIQVDAKTGAVVSAQVETPADQARENAADARARTKPHSHH